MYVLFLFCQGLAARKPPNPPRDYPRTPGRSILALEARRGPMREPAASRRGHCQLLSAVGGAERVDHFVEGLAGQHLVELVEGQVDAVVGHPSLREIVGADPLGAVARA